ncbi:hypothetical protein ACLKA7_001273 [Drosophila subpalustris]
MVVNTEDGEDESSAEEAEWPEDLEPELKGFLEEELALFGGLHGVSHIAEHTIRLKDDKPLKPGNAESDRRTDYRQLNAHSIPDAYPLRHARFISTLDLKQGYWQIPMAADSRECTAFTVPGPGLYQWRVMPFGLPSACATFQRALDTVIGPEMEPHAFAYLDDIDVIGATKEQHIANLREVFRRLKAANLKLNWKKCSFFRKRLVYLGHVVSGEGICTDSEKVGAIQNLKAPANCKELRQCLGMASWYRRFVPNFATLVQPMTELLKKGRKWSWGEEQEKAVCQLKEKLTTAPVLACPDFSARLVLQTDASDYGLGAVLTQTVDGQERIIAGAVNAVKTYDGLLVYTTLKYVVRCTSRSHMLPPSYVEEPPSPPSFPALPDAGAHSEPEASRVEHTAPLPEEAWRGEHMVPSSAERVEIEERVPEEMLDEPYSTVGDESVRVGRLEHPIPSPARSVTEEGEPVPWIEKTRSSKASPNTL